MNKTNDLIEHVSSFENTRVSKGAKVMVPNEDARALLRLAKEIEADEPNTDNKRNIDILCAYITNLSEAVLNAGYKVSSNKSILERYLPVKEDAVEKIVSKM